MESMPEVVEQILPKMPLSLIVKRACSTRVSKDATLIALYVISSEQCMISNCCHFLFDSLLVQHSRSHHHAFSTTDPSRQKPDHDQTPKHMPFVF